jgi:hypothetical protein
MINEQNLKCDMNSHSRISMTQTSQLPVTYSATVQDSALQPDKECSHRSVQVKTHFLSEQLQATEKHSSVNNGVRVRYHSCVAKSDSDLELLSDVAL